MKQMLQAIRTPCYLQTLAGALFIALVLLVVGGWLWPKEVEPAPGPDHVSEIYLNWPESHK